ncbi:TniB family NTP-binding protein [Phenylobacterium sp.]|uniref:TniB family NTP-binding protein n=1 Tax=Phenylobacterium sp. TaxID=1871053 RepID=UPI0025F9D5EF|nr:TniB family NTP-binding protein [Phenylobacterium sp.]
MSRDLVALAAQRRALLDGIFVETPRTNQAHQKFHYLMEHAAVTPACKLAVLLIAPSQSGKSKLIESFASTLNTPELLAARKIPVLHVTLHAEVTRKGLAQDILLALQALDVETGPMKGSEQEMWERVYRYLAYAGVRLLVLDEIHHLKYSNIERMARSVGECIKHALLKGPCPVVLSGIEAAELPFQANEQLQQRSIPAIQLAPFLATNPSDLDLFIEFMVEYIVRIEELGVAKHATNLIQGDIPACILEVSGGVLGAACRLIKEAVHVMTLAGRSEIRREDLVKATDEAFIRGNLEKPNPFVVGLTPLRAA